jgi:uncharacterized protein (TIGR02246 family)
MHARPHDGSLDTRWPSCCMLRTSRRAVPLPTALLVLLAALSAACAAEHGAAQDRERERLEQRQASFVEAVQNRDAQHVASLFADDAVMHVANRPAIVGRAQIQAFYSNLFGFMTESRILPEATRVSVAGDMAYSFGSTANTFGGPDGPTEYAGKYVLIWRRHDGEWLIDLYAISSDA